MVRQLLASLFAFLLVVVVLGAGAFPAMAAHYRAEPAVAPMQDEIVLRDTLWQRNGGVFEAGRSNSRPAIVCAVLVREVGPLKSFSIGGAPVSEADLQKCNARAKR